MSCPRTKRPANSYESGKQSLSGSWSVEHRPVEWLHAQLRLINRLGVTEYQRGRRDVITAELARRGAK